MKVLVINSGSSSIKYKLFLMEDLKELASGLIERIGEKEGVCKLKAAAPFEFKGPIPDHGRGFELMVQSLIDSGVIASLKEVAAFGHRVVHGGEHFHLPTLVNTAVLTAIEELIPLAPLHNPANLAGIKTALSHAPETPNVAVFDTAFHQSMPKHAYLYALPRELYEKYSIRRYGFHGTSHRYIAKEAAKFLGKRLEGLNIISLHLGNGDSATAIHKGMSIDTSMGMTPLEGLMRKTGKSAEEMDTLLNKESGLKGICGDNDMRVIIARAESGDELAQLALDMFIYRVKKYIGAYSAILGYVDCVVFAGGIGEHSAYIREKVCEGMIQIPGISIDPEVNAKADEQITLISTKQSPIDVVVVPTNEELEIAIQTKELLSGEVTGELD